MTRIALSAAVVAAAVVMSARVAQACSCAVQTPATYVAQADQVYLARAGADMQTNAGIEVTFDVIHVIKGKPSTSFTWVRSEPNPMCGPAYKPGQLAVLFVVKGGLSLCSGNSGTGSQVRELSAYLKAAKQKTASVELEPMGVALEAALKGFTHNRKKIRVHYSPLEGKRRAIWGSELSFVASKKKATRGSVQITRAFAVGDIAYVAGTYATEGVAFWVVIGKKGKSFSVLHSDVVER